MITGKEHPGWRIYLSFLRPKLMMPDLELRSLAELDIKQHLDKRDIKAVVLDVDNTLTSHNKYDFYNGAIEDKVREIKDNFMTLLFSNGPPERMKELEKYFGIRAVDSNKRKPHPEPFQRAVEYFQALPSEIALIDDSTLTGIVGGNKAGFYTIKVSPLDIKSEPREIRLARRFADALFHFYTH